MLASLSIKNYVLIDSLEVSFPEGLVIITGQTGAGKSILLGALGLALGAKADASAIAEGADTCTVEAEFSAPDLALKPLFEEEDLPWEDGGLILRRVLSRAGRSRCFVNDCPASAPFLTRIAPYLLDIHSQHQNLLLTDRRFQLSLLDYYAGDGQLLSNVGELYAKSRSLAAQISNLEQRIATAGEESELNKIRLDRLNAAGLKEGELESLLEEEKRLSNAEAIKASLCAAQENLSGEDAPLDSRLRAAGKELDRLARFYPDCAALSQRLESSRLEIEDILAEIESRNESFEDASARLEAVQERISLLQGLLRKHGCATEAELIAQRDTLAALLSDDGALQIELNALRKQAMAVGTELNAASSVLHEARAKAAGPLSDAVTQAIRALELDYAMFRVEVKAAGASAARGSQPAQAASDAAAHGATVPQAASDAAAHGATVPQAVPVPVPTGWDEVRFLFSSNGTEPVPVEQCASGGEISRIMLCLKDFMARYAHMPTMVFDEIDSGVSGSVADKMGSLICAMGERMQVIAITHLPQVAAKGRAHYLVTKDFDPATHKALSGLKRLSDDERVLELARMLSGSTLTPEAIQNAKVLLG